MESTPFEIDFNAWSQPEFWQTLNLGMAITEDRSLAECSDFGQRLQRRDDDWQECIGDLQTDGYFAYQGWLDSAPVDRLAAVYYQLEALGFPTIFAFVFDPFWDVLLQLDPLLEDLIDDYEIPAAIWTWLVRPESPTAFAPHRDQIRDAGVDDEEHLDYLTLWIPLSDLDHRTSNICVLPASADPDYGTGRNRTVIDDPQAIRCLQGPRGSVFGWTTGLIHWGTRPAADAKPRLSLGACVQSPDAICHDPPILDFYRPLTLETRLSIIAQQIVNYSRHLDKAWIEHAERWLAR